MATKDRGAVDLPDRLGQARRDDEAEREAERDAGDEGRAPPGRFVQHAAEDRGDGRHDPMMLPMRESSRPARGPS